MAMGRIERGKLVARKRELEAKLNLSIEEKEELDDINRKLRDADYIDVPQRKSPQPTRGR
jgi:hypothetical protein